MIFSGRITVGGNAMKLSITLLGAALAFASGCGGDGGSGGGTFPPESVLPPVVPSALPAADVPRAAAASGAVDLATQAATNVILDGFTDGEATGAPHVFLSPVQFQYAYSLDFEVDLDSQGRAGNDRFPNISGLLLISVDATLEGTWLAGEASHTVVLEAGSDITTVDPGSGIETLIPEGSTWTFDLGVTWEVTDSQNWIVVATATKSVDVEGLVVIDGDSVLTVNIAGGREVVCGIAKVDGEIVKERTISGSFTVTLDDGADVVTVIIEFDNDGLILVTIGDDVFGPFTPQEFREFFGLQFV
jgi:hypothetical protein